MAPWLPISPYELLSIYTYARAALFGHPDRGIGQVAAGRDTQRGETGALVGGPRELEAAKHIHMHYINFP